MQHANAPLPPTRHFAKYMALHHSVDHDLKSNMSCRAGEEPRPPF